MQIPPNVYWYDAVQVVLLLLLGFGVSWLIRRSLEHGDRLLKLELKTGNHYAHRFEQIRKRLGIEEWEEE